MHCNKYKKISQYNTIHNSILSMYIREDIMRLLINFNYQGSKNLPLFSLFIQVLLVCQIMLNHYNH